MFIRCCCHLCVCVCRILGDHSEQRFHWVLCGRCSSLQPHGSGRGVHTQQAETTRRPTLTERRSGQINPLDYDWPEVFIHFTFYVIVSAVTAHSQKHVHKIVDMVMFSVRRISVYTRFPTDLQIGSYFGSVLCPLDVDRDGVTDLLLVGAPMYMSEEKKETGKVYIFTITNVSR